jgi:DNA/RNA-binding domain of Phe-tRNA-synthetase-like protein
VSSPPELRAATGFVEPAIGQEFPGLRLDWVTVQARPGHSPPGVKQRLGSLANRFRGADVVAMRTKPVPRAYRTFYRQIGLDPDTSRVPGERAAVARLLHGGFPSVDLVHDALLIAVVETGVPIWALDAEHVDAGGLGIRTTTERDRLGAGDQAEPLTPGSLAVADAEVIHALLFDDVAPAHAVRGGTERIALYAIGVDGVPAIHIEESLWLCADVLRAGARAQN